MKNNVLLFSVCAITFATSNYAAQPADKTQTDIKTNAERTAAQSPYPHLLNYIKLRIQNFSQAIPKSRIDTAIVEFLATLKDQLHTLPKTTADKDFRALDTAATPGQDVTILQKEIIDTAKKHKTILVQVDPTKKFARAYDKLTDEERRTKSEIDVWARFLLASVKKNQQSND